MTGRCADFVVQNGRVMLYTTADLAAGTAAYWTCNTGYAVGGDSPVVCSPAGEWTFKNQPTCTSFIGQIQTAATGLPGFLPSEVPGLFALNQTADNTALTSLASDAIQYILSGFTPAQTQLIGYPLSDLLLDCSFEGRICKPSDIEFGTLDPELGNCYTFNHMNMTTPYAQSSPGEAGGLYIALNVNQEEYLSFVISAGFRFIFHDQLAQLIPQVMGDYVAPGFLTQFSIEKVTTNRINTPTAPCVNGPADLPSSTPYYYGQLYSTEACTRSGVQAGIFQQCACASPLYALSTVLPTYKQQPKAHALNCPLAQMTCMVNYTNSAVMNTLIENITSTQCPQLCRNNLAIVRAYYGTLSHIAYTERLDVTLDQLIAAIGGLLLICFGMSAISLVECCWIVHEAIVQVCQYFRPSRLIRVSLLAESFDEKVTRKNILMATIHGVRSIGTSRAEVKVRVFWSICLVFSACAVWFLLSGVMSDYQAYRTVVDITINVEPLTFPAVTFCNLNPYKKSLIQVISPAEALIAAINAETKI